VSNGGAKAYNQCGSDLEKILNEAVPLKMTERAKVVYDLKLLRMLMLLPHNEGDTEPVPGDENNGFHFITFVKGEDGHLWE